MILNPFNIHTQTRNQKLVEVMDMMISLIWWSLQNLFISIYKNIVYTSNMYNISMSKLSQNKCFKKEPRQQKDK